MYVGFVLVFVYKFVQDGDSLCGDNDDFDWDSEDEKEIENFASSSSSSLRLPQVETRSSSAEVSGFYFLLGFLLSFFVFCESNGKITKKLLQYREFYCWFRKIGAIWVTICFFAIEELFDEATVSFIECSYGLNPAGINCIVGPCTLDILLMWPACLLFLFNLALYSRKFFNVVPLSNFHPIYLNSWQVFTFMTCY